MNKVKPIPEVIMAKRKTINVKDLVNYANQKLKNPELSVDEKKATACFIDHILGESGNYSGFDYYDNYDTDNWNDAKEWSRFYYYEGQ
jgi:hypothetical protein